MTVWGDSIAVAYPLVLLVGGGLVGWWVARVERRTPDQRQVDALARRGRR